ncbi:MAG: LemA family protein [Acidobacteria bacterium]|nr:MAG: LemA family protein [Acidobacteriota bacterium]
MKRGCLVAILAAIGVAAVVLLLVALSLMATYNRFVSLDEKVGEAWAQVENVYQRRMDLVPNLVETVKGVANFEKETYLAVAEARAKAGQVTLSKELLSDPAAFAKFEQAQGELSTALSRLLVTVERYPELKANENFRDLQSQLEGTENRIAVERRRFNQAVREYNTAIRRFPGRLIASLFGFEEKPYFKAAEGAEKAPQVKF